MFARFDWYQATVHGEVKPIMASLERACDRSPSWEPMSRAPHGYAFGNRLSDPAGLVAQIWWGGTHELPHVVSSGESAHAVSEILRTDFEHRVARLDPCVDYQDPGAYDRLQDLAVGVAKEFRIKVETGGDHLVTMEGRTIYLGARTSHTRLRVYDKAAEMRAKMRGPGAQLLPRDWTRLEFQVRPETRVSKHEAARLSPIEVMGSTHWGRELMKRVGGLEISPFAANNVWRQSDDDRAYFALLSQYGGLLLRRLKDHGSWSALGDQIGYDLTEHRKLTKGSIPRRGTKRREGGEL